MKRLPLIVLLCLAFTAPCAVWADNVSRDYIPAPPDTLAVLTYYEHLSADSIYANGTKVANNIDFSGNIGILRVVWFTQIGPFVIDPQFLIPFGGLNLDTNTGKGGSLTTNGFGDPILAATIWFINDPKSRTWLGFTPFFYIPGGAYDNNGALSMGENRWHFREELGFVKGFEVLPEHPLYFEFTVGGDFYTDNTNYGVGGATLSQDPVFDLETHVSYDLTKTLWLSGDYYYHNGGKTSVDGIDNNDSMNNHAVGLTLGYNITPNLQLALQYKTDVSIESGLPTSTALVRLMYATNIGSIFSCKGAGN